VPTQTLTSQAEAAAAAAEMDPDGVAKAFVEHYYRTFDSNRAGLVGLYQEGSMLTFEGEKFMGAAAIAAKLTSLPFDKCLHNVVTVDCQPAGPTGGMLVFVSGSLKAGEGEHQIKFSQVRAPILLPDLIRARRNVLILLWRSFALRSLFGNCLGWP
jgi:hypothetical protein